MSLKAHLVLRFECFEVNSQVSVAKLYQSLSFQCTLFSSLLLLFAAVALGKKQLSEITTTQAECLSTSKYGRRQTKEKTKTK